MTTVATRKKRLKKTDFLKFVAVVKLFDDALELILSNSDNKYYLVHRVSLLLNAS